MKFAVEIDELSIWPRRAEAMASPVLVLELMLPPREALRAEGNAVWLFPG